MTTYSRWWSIVIGLGLALSPIHNTWLTNAFTNSEGETLFFLPAFGYLLLIMGVGMFLLNHWTAAKQNGLGPRYVYIPLLVIVVSMGVSGFIYGQDWEAKIAPLGIGVAMFGLYLSARMLGKAIFYALIPVIIVGAISTVAMGIWTPGQYTGGFITNYCASAGFLILGSLIVKGKLQWALILIATIGVFFIGANEALFIVAVMFVVILVRRDWSKRFIIVTGSVFGLALIWLVSGFLIPLYAGNGNIAALAQITTGTVPLDPDTAKVLTSGRWEVIWASLENFNVIGHGYSLSTVGGNIVHNVPLIIMYQIGPLAALAWLFVVVYLTVKTKWKYAFIAVLAMSVWDHYLWTQLTPWIWGMAGVATVSTIKNDYIFKKVE